MTYDYIPGNLKTKYAIIHSFSLVQNVHFVIYKSNMFWGMVAVGKEGLGIMLEDIVEHNNKTCSKRQNRASRVFEQVIVDN